MLVVLELPDVEQKFFQNEVAVQEAVYPIFLPLHRLNLYQVVLICLYKYKSVHWIVPSLNKEPKV